MQPQQHQKTSRPQEETQQSRQSLKEKQNCLQKTMVNLPQELLAQICCNVHLDTLPNLRLVNKQFADVAAEYLFKEIRVTFLKFESVAKLEAISNHDTLPQVVKSITLKGDSPSAGIVESHHVDCVDHPHCAILNGRHVDRSEARVMLLAAVDRLPNLMSLTLSLAMPEREDDIDVNPQRHRYCKYVGRIFNTTVPAQLKSLLPCFRAASVPLKRLDLGTIECLDFFGAFPSFDDINQLNLDLPFKMSRGPHGISHMLSSVPELQTLSLVLGNDSEAVSLENVIESFMIPKLTHVAFTHIHVSDQKLLDFFHRHAKTLRNVRLEKIDLISRGAPTDIFEGMQKVLRLEQAYVTGEFRTWSGKSMSVVSGTGTENRYGQVTQDFVAAYLTREGPSRFEVAGLEYSISRMRLRGNASWVRE